MTIIVGNVTVNWKKINLCSNKVSILWEAENPKMLFYVDCY